MDGLILIANPGSASRKYALYNQGGKCLINLHFELADSKVVYSFGSGGQIESDLSNLAFAATKILDILKGQGAFASDASVQTIALRIVAPSSYFQKHRAIDDRSIKKLTELESRSPLHINNVLQEMHILKSVFPSAKLLGISDSAFHESMPARANRYAIPAKDATALDIKRFGYHGLSVESVVSSLKKIDKLPQRLVVCHLGSGSSVTAVRSGKSLDTTMGYSPLEGLMMSTRSGNIDPAAADVLQNELKLNSEKLLDYLNDKSGLLGVSGKSGDIRALLKLGREGDEAAKLALSMYVYRVRLGIGQMAAALGGIDALAFTGTVGERSEPIRRRVMNNLTFLGLWLDPKLNHEHKTTNALSILSPKSHPAKIYVVPANEDLVIAKHALDLTS